MVEFAVSDARAFSVFTPTASLTSTLFDQDDWAMTPIELVRLAALMERTAGRPEIIVGLIDGPVALDRPELAATAIREIPGRSGACAASSSWACIHGTFVAGVLSARRGSLAPAICPGCSLLVRSIFPDHVVHAPRHRDHLNERIPSATPEELAEALFDAIDAGAHVLNLSAAISVPSAEGQRKLGWALDYAARRGTLVVVAAGNQAAVGSTVITRHPWVIPVVACDAYGRPTIESNLGRSIGRHGLRAPGDNITSLGPEGKPLTVSGTSAAAPFVTGAIALIWSEFPNASAAELKLAVTRAAIHNRQTLVPPLLDAWAAYEVIASSRGRRKKR